MTRRPGRAQSAPSVGIAQDRNSPASITGPVVTLLPPSLSATFLVVTVAPLVIGFLIGIVAKTAIKLGVAVAILLGILIALGMITPDQVIGPAVSLISSGQAYVGKVKEVAGYLPYSSVTFLIGLAVGFLKG